MKKGKELILLCLTCKHFNESKGNCEAFTKIPDEFLSGEVEHKRVIKGQKNDLVYESA
jgi:hypothetical protein